MHQQGTTIVNTHAPNIGAPKYLKPVLTQLKGERHSNMVTVEAFDIQHATVDSVQTPLVKEQQT